MGVLGSGENGVQKFREQGAWGQKDQGAGSKGKYSREQGAEDSGQFIKQFYILSGFFSVSLRSANFLPYIVHLHQ